MVELKLNYYGFKRTWECNNISDAFEHARVFNKLKNSLTIIVDHNDANEFFNNPEYSYLGSEEKTIGKCPFCGGDITVISSYKFQKDGIVIKVMVNAACRDCGAI
jgi:hypothetical protein